MADNQPIKSPFLNEMEKTRMILMLESEPLSDMFRQIMLTPEQFRAISDLLFHMMPKHPAGGILMPTQSDVQKIINTSDCYTQEFINSSIAKGKK